METVDKFRKRYTLIFTILNFIGVALFKDKAFNWRLALCAMVTFLGNLSAVYTLFITRHTFTVFFKCMCACMQGIMGIVKLSLFAKKKDLIENLFLYIESVRLANLRSTANRQEILAKTTVQYNTMMKGLKITFGFILLGIIMNPFYALVHLHKFELFFEIQLIGFPMKNSDALTYALNSGAQILELFYAYQGTFVYDITMFTLVFQIYLNTKLVKEAFNEAEDQMEENPYRLYDSLRNCLLMLQDINCYIMELKVIFSTVIFFQISSSSVKLALGLFTVVTTEWIGGVGFALLSFIEIMMYCVLGTFLEQTNEKLAHIIYEFKWYMIPRKHQKMIVFALMKTQNTAQLTIGGVVALNVETGGSILKTVYTYLMVLLNFVE